MQRKKKIGIHTWKNRFIAGSPWNHGTAPPTEPKSETIKVELKPAEIKPPQCPHGVQLTSDEVRANQYECSRLSNKEWAARFEKILFRSSACLRCNPVCEHGQPMSKEEVKVAKAPNGKRFSSQCAACTGSESVEDWEKILKFYGLSAGRGMSPTKHIITKQDGSTRFLGQQKNFQTGGDIEKRDANSSVSREDIPARSNKPKGHGSDTIYDDNFAGAGEGDGSDDSTFGLRTREIQELRSIDVESIPTACEAHGIDFCGECFSSDDIQRIKEEVAEARQMARREQDAEVDHEDVAGDQDEE